MFKTVIALFALVAVAQCGVVPVASYAAVAPYASSYNAHSVTHSVAAAAPLAVAPAAYTAYSALPYSALPAAYHHLGAYPAAAAYTTFV